MQLLLLQLTHSSGGWGKPPGPQCSPAPFFGISWEEMGYIAQNSPAFPDASNHEEGRKPGHWASVSPAQCRCPPAQLSRWRCTGLCSPLLFLCCVPTAAFCTMAPEGESAQSLAHSTSFWNMGLAEMWGRVFLYGWINKII